MNKSGLNLKSRKQSHIIKLSQHSQFLQSNSFPDKSIFLQFYKGCISEVFINIQYIFEKLSFFILLAKSQVCSIIALLLYLILLSFTPFANLIFDLNSISSSTQGINSSKIFLPSQFQKQNQIQMFRTIALIGLMAFATVTQPISNQAILTQLQSIQNRINLRDSNPTTKPKPQPQPQPMPMPGGWSARDVSTISKDINLARLEGKARTTLERQLNVKVIKLVSLSQQVVEGMNYRFEYTTNAGGYIVGLYWRPWTSTEQVTSIQKVASTVSKTNAANAIQYNTRLGY